MTEGKRIYFSSLYQLHDRVNIHNKGSTKSRRRKTVAFEFKLPDIGEGIHEGEIVKWFVKPNDEINEDDVLAEVQNDKAVVEIPSPVKGKVLELKVEEGTVATVGQTIITFDAPGYENLQFKGSEEEGEAKLKLKYKVLLKLVTSQRRKK